MSHRTKHQIAQAIDQLKHARGATDAPTAVTVNWRDAASEARPTGITYDAEIATLTYDCWAAQ